LDSFAASRWFLAEKGAFSMLSNAFPICGTLVVCLLSAACGKDDYTVAVANGQKTIPYVREFNQIFTDTNHFITHYKFADGNWQWNSEAFLYRRYVVTMQVDVTYDKSATNVVAWGKPAFFLTEIKSVVLNPNGSISPQEDNQQFGIDAWKKLVEARGNLSVLGVKVVKDSPVEHFDSVKAINR
jgi:hypothetical protein